MEYTSLTGEKTAALRSTTQTALYLLRFNVALQIAIAAIGINLFLAIATFFYGWNSLYCAFGADSIIGVLTAMILVWRFASSKCDQNIVSINLHVEDNENNYNNSQHRHSLRDNYEDNNRDNHVDHNDRFHPFLRSMQSTIEDTPDDNRRELWSTFWLGQIMIVSGFGVVIRSIIELVHNIVANAHPDEYDNLYHTSAQMKPLYVLAVISLAMNILLMGFKLFVYYHLNSNSMLIEGVNSFISAIFAATTIISIQFHETIEYLDQIVSIIFGVFLISYGVYNVLHTITFTLIDLIKQKCDRQRTNEYVRLP